MREPLSTADIRAGFRRLASLPRSSDGDLHFKRDHTSYRVNPAEAAALIGLIWTSGHREKDLLLLKESDFSIEGNNLLVHWQGGQVGEYPQDQHVTESIDKIIAWRATLKQGAPFFEGRSRRYGIPGENPLAGHRSIGWAWLAVKGTFGGWTPRYLRLSGVFRIWLEGGVPLVQARTGLKANSVHGLGNPFIWNTWLRRQAELHPPPVMIEVA
jgi:integrase